MVTVRVIATCAVSKGKLFKDVNTGGIWFQKTNGTYQYFSGFFWRHPLLLELGWEYYWRVEPDVRYFCELDYDPFVYMKENGKQYGKCLCSCCSLDSNTYPDCRGSFHHFVCREHQHRTEFMGCRTTICQRQCQQGKGSFQVEGQGQLVSVRDRRQSRGVQCLPLLDQF